MLEKYIVPVSRVVGFTIVGLCLIAMYNLLAL